MNNKTLIKQPTREQIKIKTNENDWQNAEQNTTMKSQVLTADVPCLQMNYKNVIRSLQFLFWTS